MSVAYISATPPYTIQPENQMTQSVLTDRNSPRKFLLVMMQPKGLLTGRRLAPVHPGIVLLEDFIEPLGITRYRLAEAIDVQQRRMDEICAGKRAISTGTAVRLGVAVDVAPQFWLNLQAPYNIEVIQREQGAQLSEEVQQLTV